MSGTISRSELALELRWALHRRIQYFVSAWVFFGTLALLAFATSSSDIGSAKRDFVSAAIELLVISAVSKALLA